MAELKPIPPTHGEKPAEPVPSVVPVAAQPEPQPHPDQVKVPMGGVSDALRAGKTTFAGKGGTVEK